MSLMKRYKIVKISNKLRHSFRDRSTTAAAAVTGSAASYPTTIKNFNEIPGPFRFPIIGNLYLYKLGYYNYLEYHNVLKKLNAKYGPIVREQLGDRTIIHLFEPDDVKTVHSIEGSMPEIPPLQEATQFYRKNNELSPGLGTANGQEWYRLRNAVQQMMMRPKEVYYYLPFVDKVANTFVQKIEKNLDKNHALKLDLRVLVAKWSLESSGMICFEKSLGCLNENEELAEKIIQTNKEVFYLTGLLKFSLPFYKYISTPSWNKFVQAENFLYKTSKKFIDDSISQINTFMKNNNNQLINKYNFLTFLLSRNNLSEKDVHVLTLSLFSDGLSTTTPAFMYNMYCLAKNQDKQEKLYNEIKEIVPLNETITVDMMNQLQYLKASVKETFRLYPIGTDVSRITNADLVLANYKIPAGTHVDLNQWVHLRSPTYFEDPNDYRPERWLRDSQQSVQGISPYLLLPFGHGTRMCAGRRFAEQDLYTSIARILQKFRIELVDSSAEMEQIYNTLLFPKHPLKLKFIKR